jgi:hypothetical protein
MPQKTGRGRHERDHLATVIGGYLTGAGSLHLATGSGVVTATVATLTVLLTVVVRGRRSE